MPLTPAEIDAVGTNAANKVMAVMSADRDSLFFAPAYWTRRMNDPSIKLPASTLNTVAEVAAAQKTTAARDAKVDALLTELTALGSGLSSLGTALEVKLEAALVALPAEIQAALAAALVHVDITVTGPVPPAV